MFKITMNQMNTILSFVIFNTMSISIFSCTESTVTPVPKLTTNMIEEQHTTHNFDTATFGAGCFWCIEAVYQQVEGVLSVTSGYSGGAVKNPTYKEVCNGTTGHAEVCQIVFDPKVITYPELLQAFWVSHDPTTLNRQGNDVGTQYRSVIYYHTPIQKELAEKYKKGLNASHAYPNPIVTEISPLTEFFKAEDYHQNYYNENVDQPYCQFVVKPKLEKFQKVFKEKLKIKASN